MHIRELRPKNWDPYNVLGTGHQQLLLGSQLDPVRLGDVVVMHSRGRWGTALVTKIGRKNLTASYVTQGGIDSRPRFPNVTNKSVPIGGCWRTDPARVWSDWHVPSDDDLPQAVNDRVGKSHNPASGSPGPTRLVAMFTLG